MKSLSSLDDNDGGEEAMSRKSCPAFNFCLHPFI